MITCNVSMTTLFWSDEWRSSNLTNILPATRGDAVNEGNMQVPIGKFTLKGQLLALLSFLFPVPLAPHTNGILV